MAEIRQIQYVQLASAQELWVEIGENNEVKSIKAKWSWRDDAGTIHTRMIDFTPDGASMRPASDAGSLPRDVK